MLNSKWNPIDEALLQVENFGVKWPESAKFFRNFICHHSGSKWTIDLDTVFDEDYKECMDDIEAFVAQLSDEDVVNIMDSNFYALDQKFDNFRGWYLFFDRLTYLGVEIYKIKNEQIS